VTLIDCVGVTDTEAVVDDVAFPLTDCKAEALKEVDAVGLLDDDA
jgi:hypothetical protein